MAQVTAARSIWTILFLTSLFAVPVWADMQFDNGDVCALRPDLCDETASSSNVKAKKQADVMIKRNAETAKSKPRAKGQRHCRNSQSFSITEQDLPVCKPKPQKGPQVTEEASTDALPPSRDFNAYFKTNANHPALARHPARAVAFAPQNNHRAAATKSAASAASLSASSENSSSVVEGRPIESSISPPDDESP